MGKMIYEDKNIYKNLSVSFYSILRHKFFIVLAYVMVFCILLPLFLFVTGIRLDVLMPVKTPGSFIYKLIGIFSTVSGFALIFAASAQLKVQGKGLPISHLPPQLFVKSGVYNFFRHPIYAGSVFVFLGISLVINSFWSMIFSTFLLSSGSVAYAIFYEEPILLRRFGTEYSDYRRDTPLLIPYKITDYISKKILPVKTKILDFISWIAGKVILYQKGNFILAYYGLFYSVAAIVMAEIMLVLLNGLNLTLTERNILITGTLVSDLFFSRLFWWMGNFHKYRDEKFGVFKNTGLVSWGGLTGMLINAAFFSIVFNCSFLFLSDVIFTSGFLAYAIGRVGCISYGCCYGIISEKRGINFSVTDSKAVRETGLTNVFRYPTQLYSIYLGLFLFVVNILLIKLSPPEGLITALSLMLYGFLRSFIEFFRDRKRIHNGIFTAGHIGCLVIFILGWLMLFIISPGYKHFAHKIFSQEAIKESLQSLPVIFILGIICFIFTATHWKKLGRW